MNVNDCGRCGVKIPEDRRSDARYCSHECTSRAKADRSRLKNGITPVIQVFECDVCAGPIDSPRTKRTRYCSPDCETEGRRKRRTPQQRARALKRNFKMTPEQFQQMLETQGGCASCGTNEPTGQGWCVDHDHACCPKIPTCGDCVRGILCSSCNRGLGFFGDDADKLLAASLYLLRTSVRKSVRHD